MDFTFDEVQEELRALAARIVGEEVTTERLRELEAGTERVDRRLWNELAKANLLGIALPERFGGMGYGIMELAIVLTEVGRNVAPVPALATLVLGALPVARFGSDEQQARLLPGVVDGTRFLTAALEEPGIPDIRRPATTARAEGDAWVLGGEKVAVPWGLLADTIVVSASVDGEPALFLVDAGDVDRERADGTHREPQANVTLRNAHAELLARGAEAITYVEQHALAGLCAIGVGVFDRAIRITAGYIAEREQFGKPLATFQGATLRAADAYIDTQAITVTTWSAIWRLAEGRPAADELAIAKFWVADGGQRVAHACQHLHGGMGVDIDYPIHRYFLWAKELELRLGGATAQLLRIGESLAGV